MDQQLKILHLEDNKADAELVRIALEGKFPKIELHHIYKKADFISHMQNNNYSLILSDYNLPGFDGMEALETALKMRPDWPFIFISGTIGEERAVEALRLGATDYVLKENMAKLPFVIKRAIKEKHDREEKENTKQEIFQAHQLLESVFDNTHMQVAYLDVNMNFLKVNKAYAITENQLPEYFLGKNHFALFPNKENERIFYDVVRTGKPHFAYAREFFYEHQPEKGATYWDWSLVPTLDAAGKVMGLVVTLLNVTERIKAETNRKLAEQNLQFATDILNRVSSLVIVVNKKTDLIYVSPSAKNVLGYQPHELLGQNWWKLTTLDNKQRTQEKQLAQRILKKGLLVFDHYHEREIKTKSGKIKWIAWSKAETDDGLLIGVGQDITLRKQAEKSLALSEHRYRTLFENMNEGLLFSTENGEIIFVNNQFEKLTGYSSKELVGKNGYELLLDESERKQTKSKVRYRKIGLSEQYELKVRKKNGEYLWVHISASPSVDQEGNFSGIMSLVTDISNRKKTEEQLEAGRLQALQYHSMLLSSQINPHFIFNALNSVQFYILDRNTEPALNFISEFSKLMRTTLQNSLHKTISIANEIEYLKLYLELERKRYDNKFDYVIKISKGINPEDYYIPPMLLQPYIENTVVHGLGNKQGKGKVKIEFREEKNQMICTISDNGVGRKKAMELRTLRVGTHQSLGMSLIETRMNLLRELNKAEFEVVIKDLKNDSGKATGTEIKVIFPVITEFGNNIT